MAILGIDEVGRGPFAGPLVVGAVVLPEFGGEKPVWYAELKDSKKLSAKKRAKLAEILYKEAAVGLGFVMAGELDRLGMNVALRLGAKRAVREIQRQQVKFTEVVIDGTMNFLAGTTLGKYTTTLIKGDDLIKEISAASIVAKCARDGYMERAAEEYPEYGFEKHVGYGTLQHREAITKYGLCPEHRRLIKNLRPIAEAAGEDLSLVFAEEVKKDTTRLGGLAEDAVCEYLEKMGQRVVARNFKTKLCEIDIISVDGDKIYFTEVKYRKNENFGGGLEAIDQQKIHKMELGVACYQKLNPNQYNPLLAVANVAGEFEVKDWFALR